MNPYVLARETAERANGGVTVIGGGRVSVSDSKTRLKEVDAAFNYARSRGDEFFEAFRSTFFDDRKDVAL